MADILDRNGSFRLEDLPEEVFDQLCLLENSQQLMLPIFLGLLLQYKAIDVQRTELLAGVLEPGSCRTAGCPDPKTMQLSSSLIILSSLLGFQNQTERISQKAAAAGGCPDGVDATLGMIVILIALIRFARLLDTGEQNSGTAQQLEAAAVEDTEVI